MMFHNAAALILAGGRSSRMGRDKVLLPLQGQTLLERAVDFWSALCPEVLIAAGSSEHLAELPGSAVYDSFPGCGPLAGLEAGLSRTTQQLLFVCAVDMPYLSVPAAQLLYASIADHDIAVFHKNNRREPLFGLYRQRCLPDTRALLTAGLYKMGMLLDRLDTLVLNWTEPNLFENINTPQEYAQVRECLKDETTKCPDRV